LYQGTASGVPNRRKINRGLQTLNESIQEMRYLFPDFPQAL
jgi:hypothetical protein